MFDPALAPDLVAFFRTALARDAASRHDTAEAMRTAWQSIFATDATTEPGESNDELAARATLATPLAESGLTARALSALEPYAVQTVGDLLTVDPVRLSRMQGVANATRLQITARIKEWRERLGDPREGRSLAPASSRPPPRRPSSSWASSPLRAHRAAARWPASSSAWAPTSMPSRPTPSSPPTCRSRSRRPARPRSSPSSRRPGPRDDAARGLLDQLADAVSSRLTELGSIATPAELADAVSAALAAEDAPDRRLLEGLLRFALERRRALNRADGSSDSVWLRRRAGRVVLLADDQDLFDVAEALGREADALVAGLDDPTTLDRRRGDGRAPA